MKSVFGWLCFGKGKLGEGARGRLELLGSRTHFFHSRAGMQGAGARTAQTMLGRPGLARALCSVRHPACTTARAVPPPPQVSVSSSFSLQPRRLVHSGHGASPRLARPLNPRLTSQPYASIHAQSPTPSASINTVVAEPPDTTTLPLPDPSLADFSQADAALPQEHLLLYPAAVSEEEEEELLAELLKPLGRDRYSTHHWDEAIVHYREMYRSRWRRPRNVATVARLRRLAVAADPHVQLSPPVHVLDLAADGIIRAHTDSLRFCGDIVAGLSLLSDAVMTFRSADPAST